MLFRRRSESRTLVYAIMAVFVLLSIKIVQVSRSYSAVYSKSDTSIILGSNTTSESIKSLSDSLETADFSHDHGNHHTIFDFTPKLYDNSVAVPWSVSYSPLQSSGSCKPLEAIKADFDEMVEIGFSRVRLPSSDCAVLDALKATPQLKAILGIYIDGDSHMAHSAEVAYENDHKYKDSKVVGFLKAIYVQLKELIDSGLDIDSQIDMLVVGCEAGLYNQVYSRFELVKMLKFVRLSLPNYRGFISTAEPVESYISATRFNAASAQDYYDYEDNEDLCTAVDSIGLISQPYFNSAMEAANSAALVQRDVRFAKYICSEKFIGSAHRDQGDDDIVAEMHSSQERRKSSSAAIPITVLEAGWPSSGVANGNAVASQEEQLAAVEELIMARDLETNKFITVNIHSYHNEYWRDSGSLDVESSFGISHLYQH